MQVITKVYKVYSFSELSDSAKQQALNDNSLNLDNFWQECAIDDVKKIAALMGIDIKEVYFSGFFSQGDGACFIGDYEYKKGSVKSVMEYAPQDTDLHDIVQTLASIQKRNFYQLYGSVSHSGHYYHEYCTDIELRRDNANQDTANYDYEPVRECLRDFMRWIYSRLETAYDYEVSEENFSELCKIDDYTFFESGHIH